MFIFLSPKMAPNKKAKTDNGPGLSSSSRRNGRRAASEVTRENNVYMSTKIEISQGGDVTSDLRSGYHKLLTILQECNETCVFLPVIPLSKDCAIVDPDELPDKMSALMKHFTVTSRIRERTHSVWATIRLGFDGDFETLMNYSDYDLRAAKIALMKKRLQMPFTETICYLQFVKNTIDTESAQKVIQGDLKSLDPDV